MDFDPKRNYRTRYHGDVVPDIPADLDEDDECPPARLMTMSDKIVLGRAWGAAWSGVLQQCEEATSNGHSAREIADARAAVDQAVLELVELTIAEQGIATLSHEEQVQEGVLAAFEALERYASDFSQRFVTYVRQNVVRALRSAAKEEEHGSAAHISLERATVELSCDAPDDGADKTLRNAVVDTTVQPVEEVMDAALLSERIHTVLGTLTYREREVLKLRYGIDDGYTYTLEEVGRIFRITRERVRQIEAKAISKLQYPTRRRRLEPFVSPRQRCSIR